MASPPRRIAISHCAACKYFKRKCPPDCIFEPYFPDNEPAKFECVHKVFTACNVGKMLKAVEADQRAEAANSLYFEARSRLDDRVYGITKMLSQLNREIQYIEAQTATIKSEIEKIKALVTSQTGASSSNYSSVGYLQPQLQPYQVSTSNPNSPRVDEPVAFTRNMTNP
ncbi:LOB domain-containing protein 24-like [Macadamia integrifolia]|uniref:LOB domain-containing protein 24-like n=1 Tax=Macadamia integrifolia TaxID=60698 RepID=UPI001C4FD089|nr:LOB domain-containing protein 24-like [Macadamia integrifolia]